MPLRRYLLALATLVGLVALAGACTLQYLDATLAPPPAREPCPRQPPQTAAAPAAPDAGSPSPTPTRGRP